MYSDSFLWNLIYIPGLKYYVPTGGGAESLVNICPI